MHILYARWLKSIIYPSQNTSHCEIHRKLNTAEIFTLSKNETPPDEIIHIVFFVVKKELFWYGRASKVVNKIGASPGVRLIVVLFVMLYYNKWDAFGYWIVLTITVLKKVEEKREK